VLIEHQQRESRVRFQHPIRVVTLEGQPRVIRTLTSNVSRDGLFLRMPEPLPPGMKVALSLEAGGRALALAQAEVMWNGRDENEITERFPGCGVRFTEFMHPRAEELVRYLVRNLDTGKPLTLAPPERRWMKWFPLVGGGALAACAVLAAVIFWGPSEVAVEPEEMPAVELIAAAPIVHAMPVVVPEAEAAPVEPVKKVVAVDAAGDSVESGGPRLRSDRTGDLSEASQTAVDPSAAPVLSAVEVTPPVPAEPSVVKASRPVLAEPSVVAKPKPPVLPERSRGATASNTTPRNSREPDQQGDVKLPTGAAPTLHWEVTGTELRLTPSLAAGAQVTRAFVLTGPARAVFDISGGVPERSHVVPASPPYASAVRLGKQATGTRIVIDLDSAPKRTSQDGMGLVLGF
jgi:hypothetical protein